jgi:glycosyltransferase involved in cell wall biosynthesis
VKVLISAYACEPNKGSEPGAGWNWSLAAARDNEVWVLTRANNRAPIAAELAARPVPSLHFIYIDPPRTWTRWKKGQRGVRLYYSVWQLMALAEARRLHEEIGFDVVHHLTFANMWLPALTCFVDAPFVLGPVGGGPRVPLRHYRQLGMHGAGHEVAREVGRILSRASPLTRASWRHSTIIVAQNEESLAAIAPQYRSKTVIRPNACVPDSLPKLPSRARRDGGQHQAVFAGRLLPWKGAAIAIETLRTLATWNLTIVGSGPDLRRLENLARRRGVRSRVTFVSWAHRDHLWRLITSADALVLPSLRDDSPLIVAEAQALGVPVVAFDQGGPREFARHADSTVKTVSLGATDIALALATALARATALPRTSCADPYAVKTISSFLGSTYSAAAGRPRRPNKTTPISRLRRVTDHSRRRLCPHNEQSDSLKGDVGTSQLSKESH